MKELSPTVIALVKRKIVEDFPEFADVEPTCSLKKTQSAIGERLHLSLPKRVEEVYVLTFRKELAAEDLVLPRVVRATVTGDGKVIKVSVSK
ncbi:hypothetical protein AMJ40_05500 [candidate division TA06 bacterium DG_26]|uniref:Uncharacterized protein n=1 Tax=candidate division TA06 bacterium DG_26 TaxID=1703771 RepID=A0A0S7WH27_UNCT6|nr:MAG: hypothetical protein AMJ40_05500 [candidate division TA06 bacterium DG_26]